MMENYVKPQILFEDFSLNTNIAGNCNESVKTFQQGQCAILGTGNVAMFNDSIGACDYTESDDEYDGFCYHVPTEGNNLFNS